jgi:hypothetical protein
MWLVHERRDERHGFAFCEVGAVLLEVGEIDLLAPLDKPRRLAAPSAAPSSHPSPRFFCRNQLA